MRLGTIEVSICLLTRETRTFLSSSISVQNQSVHLIYFFFFLEQRGIAVLYSTDTGFDAAITTQEISVDPRQIHVRKFTLPEHIYLTCVGRLSERREPAQSCW